MYSVSLYKCPAIIPFNFAVHTWFVVVTPEYTSRWEIIYFQNKNNHSKGHLYRDGYQPYQGIGRFPFTDKYPWKAELVASVKGDKGSLAESMVKFIEASPSHYPYCYNYSLLGPNSNTYTQWVINNFLECRSYQTMP